MLDPVGAAIVGGDGIYIPLIPVPIPYWVLGLLAGLVGLPTAPTGLVMPLPSWGGRGRFAVRVCSGSAAVGGPPKGARQHDSGGAFGGTLRVSHC